MPSMRRPATGLSLAPFRATRYTTDDLALVTSPPYDVVEPAGFADLEMHPHNVVRLILPRESSDCDRYERAARVWDDWLASGVLAREHEEALWVYEQSAPTGDLTGVIGTIPIDEPQAVLPHEDVMPGPVMDRAQLMAAVGANLEPILLVHDAGPSAEAGEKSITTTIVDATRQRDFDICMVGQGGVRHRLWRITDATTIDAINADLAQRSVLIADGHHRFAAYQRIHADSSTHAEDREASRRGLALIVDGRQHPLALGAIHRSIPSLSLDDAVAALGKVDDRVSVHWLASDDWGATGADHTSDLHATEESAKLRLSDGERWVDVTIVEPYALVGTAGRSQLWRSLPTAVLHQYLIPELWQTPDEDVWYHHDIRGVMAAMGQGRLGVMVPALALPTVIELASQRQLLPRKSTSFGPKPRTGLLMRQFDRGS